MKTVVESRKMFFSAVFAAAASCVMAETGLTKDGTVLRFNVDEGEVLQHAEAFPADATAFVKTGAGKLELSGDNANFKGAADIVEGVVLISHVNALGKSTAADRLTDGAISVSNGAQLATCCAKVGQSSEALSKRIILSGSGPDGTGSLRLGTQVGWANQDQYVAHLVLADNALVVSTDNCRYGFGSTDLKGYELVMTGENASGQFMFSGSKQLSEGTIRIKVLQTVWQNGVSFAGGSDGRFVVDGGAILRLYNGADSTVCPWTLEFAGSKKTTLSVNGSWLNTFNGPVEFNSGETTISGGSVAFHGEASGEKSLYLLGAKAYFKSTVRSSKGKRSIGYSGTSPSLLEIGEGAAITNVFLIAPGMDRIGAVHQYGGFVKDTSMSGDLGSLGNGLGSYGYYGINGGSLSFGKFLHVAKGFGSVGMIELRGGDLTVTGGQFYIGNGGWGEVYLFEGSLLSQSSNTGVTNGIAGGRVAITLSKGDTEYTQAWGEAMKLSPAANDSIIAVNLNGGTLKAGSICRAALAEVSETSGSKAYLNFNGGVHESLYNSNSFYGNGGTALDRVTIFSGGATIRATSTVAQSADTPFLRPTGRGVASISLPEGMDNGGYIGPPEVRISGGGGEGATAHAVYDPATMTVTGIEVTCPGWDYETVPKVTVCSCDRTVTNECTAVLTDGEQVSGGLTLTGSNKLTLNAVNTYQGDTVLSGSATLVIGVAGALPSDSTVVFAGGELDNKSGVQHKKYAVDCASAIAAGGYKFYNAIDFSNGVTLDIRNAEDFPRNATRTTLIAFKGAVTGVPRFTGVGRFQRVQLLDGKLVIENIKGTVMVLR